MRTKLVLTSLLLLVSACSTSPYAGRIGMLGEGLSTMAAVNTTIIQGEEADRNRLDGLLTSIGPTRTESLPACTAAQPCHFRIALPNPPDPVPTTAAGRDARRADLRGQISRLPAQLGDLARPVADRGSGGNPAGAADPSQPGQNASLGGRGLPNPPDICRMAAHGDMARLAQVDARQVSASARDAPSQAGHAGITGQVRPTTKREIFAVLGEYGASLKAISDAADRAAFDKAADQLADTAGALAGTLGAFAGGAGAAIGPVVKGAVKLAAFGVAQGLERRRYQALKSALIQTCIPVRTLATAAGLLMQSHRGDRLAWNRSTMFYARQQVNRGSPNRGAALEAGQQAAASMNTLTVDPRIAVQQFIVAHDKLVLAVANGEGQDDAVLESVTEFVKRVDELRRATQNLP